jgi:hypothetical protein
MEYILQHHTQLFLQTNLSVRYRLICELNQMMPEGQDFITLNNLNSGSFHKLDPENMKAVLHHYKLYHAHAPSKSMARTSAVVFSFLFVNNH